MIVFSEINVVKIRTPLNFSKSKKNTSPRQDRQLIARLEVLDALHVLPTSIHRCLQGCSRGCVRQVCNKSTQYVVLHYHEIVHLGMWRYQRAVLHVVSHISIHVSKGFLALDLNATKERRLLGQLRISCEARMGRLRKIGLAGTIKDTSE